MPLQQHASSPEFSRLIAIGGIAPDKTRHETVSATEEECALLAARMGLRSLSNLAARIDIRRVAGGDAVRVGGSLKADIVQACVVSLQDVPGHIEADFETFFTETEGPARGEIEVSLDDDLDAAETVVNGMIDLGEVVAQFLSLEIDPYPRAPGVSLAAQRTGAGVTIKESPFQVLERLKTAKKTEKDKK
jgi:uncharacterized metal-binding protein YceD (DUF177 family)